MFETSVEERYKNNATFRNLVDILRAELRRYDTTPRELREAAMLAATMHESQHIKPMLISVDELRNPYWENYFKHPAKFGNWEDWESYFEYPAMFGSAPVGGICVEQPVNKKYPHNFSIVHTEEGGVRYYYICSKCGMSDVYAGTLAENERHCTEP